MTPIIQSLCSSIARLTRRNARPTPRRRLRRWRHVLPLSLQPLEDRSLPSATLYTDKADYHPEETVLISGTEFQPGAVLQIQVIRPDGSIVKGDGSFAPGTDSVTVA